MNIEMLKDALNRCGSKAVKCNGCPYKSKTNALCVTHLTRDALKYIKDLEDRHWNECWQISEYSASEGVNK